MDSRECLEQAVDEWVEAKAKQSTLLATAFGPEDKEEYKVAMVKAVEEITNRTTDIWRSQPL